MIDYHNNLRYTIKKLNCPDLHYTSVNLKKIREWIIAKIPEVYCQLKPLGWDLLDEDTYLKTAFVNHVLDWKGYKVAIHLTSSLYDFNLAKGLIKTKKWQSLRTYVGYDLHLNLLIHPVIFLTGEDLEAIFCSFDFEKGYTNIDLSHFDENDMLDSGYEKEWNWLQEEYIKEES